MAKPPASGGGDKKLTADEWLAEELKKRASEPTRWDRRRAVALSLNVGPGQFTVAKDLGPETAPDHLATVNRHNGTAAVGMPKKMMTPLDAHDLEAKTPEGLD